jgi:hypothetical protein
MGIVVYGDMAVIRICVAGANCSTCDYLWDEIKYFKIWSHRLHDDGMRL